MCGIATVFDLKNRPVAGLDSALHVMNELQKHRGPDGAGVAGFAILLTGPPSLLQAAAGLPHVSLRVLLLV